LSERFKIEKVRARDLWHLTVRAQRKLLAHTVDCYLNYMVGNSILQFDKLFT
ncbi:MAG: IS982 family transposase, partial [Lentisphaerota bacterium]